MISVLLLSAVGLALVLVGANYLVDSASAIARKFNIPDIIIGMTVVAIGTSAPEIVVSVVGALGGNSDIAIGNVIGSNICNILLILGVTALILPLPFTRENITQDIPFTLLSTIVLVLVAFDGLIFFRLSRYSEYVITRADGAILLVLFGLYILYTIHYTKKQQLKENQHPAASDKNAENGFLERLARKRYGIAIACVILVCSLAVLVAGGELFVRGAKAVAGMLGISDVVIAATVVAVGTSLPELATSVVAAFKKNTGIALGNVLGSNILNVFLALGASAVIYPISITSVAPVNFIMLIAASLFLALCAFTFRRGKLDRTEGIIFLLLYILYIYFLFK